MSEIIYMHGFGWYVWPSFLVTLIVFLILILIELREQQKIRKLLEYYFKNVEPFKNNKKIIISKPLNDSTIVLPK